MTLYIAPVVEGHTEQGCLEPLLHRIWRELLQGIDRLQVLEPFRGHRDSLLQLDGQVLVSSVTKAALKLRDAARKESAARLLVLILLDAETDCPASLAPRLLIAAKSAVPPDIPISCVLAKRMLENWIVAGCSTLTGVNGLPTVLNPPPDPEECHGSGWLNAQLRSVNKSRAYKKTIDCERFIRSMSLSDCRSNSPSFDKLCRELASCLPLATETPPTGTPS